MKKRKKLGKRVASGVMAGVLAASPGWGYDSIVVFNEIHYHPAGAGDPTLEFVEFHNQNTVDVDLSGWRVAGGIEYVFPPGTVVLGGGYVVVGSNPAALRAAAGIAGVLGPFSGMLDNGGEALRLRNHNDRVMDEVEYNDRDGWPVGADGTGASLSKRDPNTSGVRAGAWAASVALGGTPGAPNFAGPDLPLVINEVAGSARPEGGFFVELHNRGSVAVSAGGFVLAGAGEVEHVIGAGVDVAAGGYHLVTESELVFRPADGEVLALYRPGRSGLVDAVRVDDAGRARIPDGAGTFWATGGGLAESAGAPNPVPAESALVINEIMYHHRPTYAEEGSAPVEYAESAEEWVELHNRSGAAVAAGGWELDGAVRFTIPAGTEIAAGGYLVVARDAAGFAAKFPGVPVVGDWSGTLSNQGDELVLRDGAGNPADEVFYRDGSPWPEAADAGGSSLELVNPHIDNSAPGAWRASDNGAGAEWHDYEFTLRAKTPFYTPNIYTFHELRLGLLDSGVILLDKVSVVEDPGRANRELMANGDFNGPTGWKMIGTHKDSRATTDAGERILRVAANGRMNYLNNLIEGNLSSGGTPRPVQEGMSYRVSFRAKWLSGTPQLRLELYYNKLARTVILRQPERHGTPGVRNSVYLEGTGPVFRDLRHHPAVPGPGQPVEVSVVGSDPDGMGAVSLLYKVNSGVFQGRTMTLDAVDGRWKATIPGQANGALLQIYVEGLDLGGARTTEPPAGSRSRALIQVDPSVAHGRKHSVRVIMIPSEATALHDSRDILSNYRIGCTIITDEKEVAYDAGIRLRGSMFSRQDSGNTALNLKFPSDRAYRGVHSTITTRRGNRREITVKHIINQAGGIHDNYNDLLYQYGHIAAQHGMVRSEMTRFESDYLRGLPGGNGTDGTVFKMEGIREFQATQDGTPNTPKLPFPIGWISNFDIANQGTDKEIYRHNMRINSNFARDDYASIMRMCQVFSLDGRALEDAIPAAIDIDGWTRQFALMSLCGIGDTYSQGNPHNLDFYVRPGDGVVESMPWDWDFTFSNSTNSPLWGNQNVAKVFARPVYARLFHGHLRDLIRTSYNTRYLTRWFQHYGTVSGEDFSGFLGYVTDRTAYVLSQLPAAVPFRITTNNGSDFSVSGPTVLLRGDGWIDVREVRLNQAQDPVALRWTDGDSWEFTAPVVPGLNTLTLQAYDHRGSVVGNDTIRITNTGGVEPAQMGNVAISELHFHPAGGGAEEYLEMMNISGGAQVDLSGAAFTEGISFVFPANTVLAPGGRLLLVEEVAAFEGRFGTGLPVAGVFSNGSRLSNGGERLRLEGLGGVVIRDFRYGTTSPWPSSPDGGGASLVLIAPESNPDHADPLQWRASVMGGGSPGGSDAVVFAGDPDGDDNGDGLSNFMNHALGAGGRGPAVRIEGDGTPVVTYSRNLAADDVRRFVEVSDDLERWRPPGDEFLPATESAPVDGVTTLELRRVLPVDGAVPAQFVRLRAEKR